MFTFFKFPIIYISIAYQLWKKYLYFFRNLDENQKFASAKSFFHGMTVGSLGFSFNLYFFLFVYHITLYITSIPKVNEPGHVRSDYDVQKCHIDIKGLIRLCLILICCGLPLWKWKHNTIITYGQNLSIVLIQLQILITSNFFNNFKSRFLGIAANTLAPLIWVVASRLIYIFICMCSYIHQKCMN